MKRILVSLVILTTILNVSAQGYVGGTVGFSSTQVSGGDATTTLQILPEAGYSINSNWAIGAVLSYQKGAISLLGKSVNDSDATKFTFSPYARYTAFKSELVNVFIDGGLGYGNLNVYSSNYTYLQVGFNPGVSVNLNKHLSLVGKFGFLGYQKLDDVSVFGVTLDGNNMSFGLYYSF
ncbi:MAG: outer membrane beta-barrel protein [Paludibacteraceae bacterium]